MRTYPSHDSFYHFISELNRIYLTHPALSARDYREDGFSWLDCHQESRCLYAIQRNSEEDQLIAVFNFSGQTQREYTMPFLEGKSVRLLLYSEWERFGGKIRETIEICCVSENRLTCTLEPFSALLLEIR